MVNSGITMCCQRPKNLDFFIFWGPLFAFESWGDHFHLDTFYSLLQRHGNKSGLYTYVICSKMVGLSLVKRVLLSAAGSGMKNESEGQLGVKASRRTSDWQNHLSSLLHIDILKSFAELLSPFFSPCVRLPLLRFFALLTSVRPSFHWRGLYGFSDNVTSSLSFFLIFSLFFLTTESFNPP